MDANGAGTKTDKTNRPGLGTMNPNGLRTKPNRLGPGQMGPEGVDGSPNAISGRCQRGCECPTPANDSAEFFE